MTLTRALKIMLLPAVAAVLLGIRVGSAGRRPEVGSFPEEAQASGAGSVSNEDCAVCHEDLAKAFGLNPHAVLEKSPKYNLKNSCESCHGPGEEHATGNGDKTKIISFKAAASKAYNQRCLACHNKDQEVTGYGGSPHAKTGLACSDCHSVHSGARMTRLLKEAESPLCMGCHLQPRAEFSKPYHHRVKEGAVRCTDCHQPHSGIDRRQVRMGPAGETACFHCHSDKEGPFVFEHAGLRIRDCTACHEAHGSNNPKMLVRSTMRGLCLECHTKSRTGLSAQPPSLHDIRSPRYQNCTTCHVKIHGSNSSPLFLR